MGRTGMTATEAFDAIRSHSQNTNRKVIVLSQDIIDRAVALTRDDKHPSSADALKDFFPEL